MKILSRYVLKEHLGPLTFALSALTSLLLLNYVAKQFGNLVGKGLPWGAIAEFFVLSIPFTFALTVPMAVLVATLHAFSRMAAENEITALKASGVSLQRLMLPVLVAAALLTLFMLAFNDQVLPRTNHELAVLQSDIAQKKPTFALREQVINEVSPGKLYLRAAHIDEGSNRMRDVVIYDLSDPTRRRTIYADSGDLAMARNQSDLLMTLYHGQMQDVPTATPAELQRLFFDTDLVRVPGVANQFRESDVGQTKGNREMSVCEMQKQVRLSQQDYLKARHTFLTMVARARQAGVRLPPSVTKTKLPLPGRTSLGSLYCSLLDRLGVPALGAQEVVPPQKTQQGKPAAPPAAPPGATGAPVRPQGVARGVHGGPIPGARIFIPGPRTPGAQPPSIPATPTPSAPSAGVPVPGHPARPIAPSAGVTPEFTPALVPSSIEATRVQMGDAQASIDGYEIEIHKKFALAVACFIFVLLGAPIALRFPRGGVGLTIGVSLLVFALYYIGLTAGAAAASNGLLRPAIAMWMANIIFGAVALVLLARMGRETATARGGGVRETLQQWRDRLSNWMRRAGLAGERRTEESPEPRTAA